MNALEEVGQALRFVEERTTQAQTGIVEAGGTWNERGQLLAECLRSTNDPDALEMLGQHEAAAEDMREVWRKVGLVIRVIEQYRTSLGAGSQPVVTSAHVGKSETVDPPSTKTTSVTAPDGSEYPVQAGWASDEGLPPRVRRGTNTPTVGYVKINDAPLRVQSGEDGFSDMVDERLRELGVRRRSRLRTHVELKVAAMLMRSSQRHQEVVINHAPCGSEPEQTRGCHEMLPMFLRAGHSLTVYGTTATGKPFSYTYRGGAR